MHTFGVKNDRTCLPKRCSWNLFMKILFINDTKSSAMKRWEKSQSLLSIV